MDVLAETRGGQQGRQPLGVADAIVGQVGRESGGITPEGSLAGKNVTSFEAGARDKLEGLSAAAAPLFGIPWVLGATRFASVERFWWCHARSIATARPDACS